MSKHLKNVVVLYLVEIVSGDDFLAGLDVTSNVNFDDAASASATTLTSTSSMLAIVVSSTLTRSSFSFPLLKLFSTRLGTDSATTVGSDLPRCRVRSLLLYNKQCQDDYSCRVGE